MNELIMPHNVGVKNALENMEEVLTLYKKVIGNYRPLLAGERYLTDKAKTDDISNCPLCAIGHDANRKRIWKLDEMDADHVTAWSKGGSTDIGNCQMLCKTHNRAKGNR